MFALFDIWNAIVSLVHAADPVIIGIALVVILVTGLLVKRAISLLNAVVLALIGFALIKYIIAIFQPGANALVLAKGDWLALTHMQVQTLLAYFFVFGVLIAVVHLIRSVVAAK
jgi:hypothetical protein